MWAIVSVDLNWDLLLQCVSVLCTAPLLNWCNLFTVFFLRRSLPNSRARDLQTIRIIYLYFKKYVKNKQQGYTYIQKLKTTKEITPKSQVNPRIRIIGNTREGQGSQERTWVARGAETPGRNGGIKRGTETARRNAQEE